jgi:hypothetical protein
MQVVPSVLRVQEPVSGLIIEVQEPPLQTRSVRVRVRVPVSSQVPLKPPQAPQEP